MTTVDADALLADIARKRERVEEISRDARRKLRVVGAGAARRSPTYLTDGLTAEEIERDTASIYKIMAVWRQIGKKTPSPITLPSGKKLIPKRSPAASARGSRRGHGA